LYAVEPSRPPVLSTSALRGGACRALRKRTGRRAPFGVRLDRRSALGALRGAAISGGASDRLDIGGAASLSASGVIA
jgi:hypothetical protein